MVFGLNIFNHNALLNAASFFTNMRKFLHYFLVLEEQFVDHLFLLHEGHFSSSRFFEGLYGVLKFLETEFLDRDVILAQAYIAHIGFLHLVNDLFVKFV